MGSANGVPERKLLELADWRASALFDARERAALAFADALTERAVDVDDATFARLREHFDDDALVELTATIAWENASARFNRALRIGSQGLWRRAPEGGAG